MTSSPTRLLLAIVAVLALGAAALTALQDAPADLELPAVPDDAVAVPVTVLDVQPFVLGEPATHWYRAEQPLYDRGLVVVLDVADRDLLAPRQTAQPVLYVGGETAERVNVGWRSGKLVAIVPAVDGDVGALLADTRAFFGEAELPERIDRATALTAAQTARGRDLPVVPAAMAARAGGEALPFPDHGELLAWAASWVEAHAPDEIDLISGLRVPRLTR